MAGKKKRPRSPRRLRLKRQARLHSAKAWLAQQKGRTPAQIGKAYRKWYGVDWPCALAELSQLGIKFGLDWVTQLQSALAGHHRARAARRSAQDRGRAGPAFDDSDSNEYFAYIAGYTDNGAPFGVTWEEWDKLKAAEEPPPAEDDPF
ncbi:MAG: hypothetical protein AAB676_12850 [Verrucomicrobiota bacterium]